MLHNAQLILSKDPHSAQPKNYRPAGHRDNDPTKNTLGGLNLRLQNRAKKFVDINTTDRERGMIQAEARVDLQNNRGKFRGHYDTFDCILRDAPSQPGES